MPTNVVDQRQANAELNRAEHAERALVLASRPLALFVELTQNCNLRCPMCRSGSGYRADWDMTDACFDRVADLMDTALLVDLRGWGESTLLRSLPDRVGRAAESGAMVRLVTNGQLDRPLLWTEILATGGVLVVSCDAADSELFARLRRGGSLRRLEATVRSMVSVRDAIGASTDSVLLAMTVCTENLVDMPAMVELAARLDVRKLMMFPVQLAPEDPWHLRHDLDGTVRGLDATSEAAARTGVEVQFGAALDPALSLPDSMKTTCMHPWAYSYINYTGKVGFCDHLIGNERYYLGDLMQQPFEEIWNGPAWQQLRAEHARDDLTDRFAACRWCYRQRYVDFEHLLYPAYEAKRVSTSTRTPVYLRVDPATRPVIPFA